MERQELDQVRKVIESSTSKVSLRDLERKGFRKVKVLRATDIDAMITRAVADALAAGERDREELIRKARTDLNDHIANAKRAEQELHRLHQRNLELEQRLRQAEQSHQAGAGQLQALQQQGQMLEQRLEQAEGRAHSAEARVQGAEARAAEAEGQLGRLKGLREEVDELRGRLKQAETEKRLVEELEVPKLRERIAELEDEVRKARSSGGGVDEMRLVFRELMQEMGTGKTSGVDVAQELAKLHDALANVSVGAGVGDSGMSDTAATTRAKLSLDKLFQHETNTDVETNIANVSVKEKTGRGVGSALDKLKSIRKKIGD